MKYNQKSLEILREDFKKFNNAKDSFFAATPFLVMGEEIFLGMRFFKPEERESHRSIENTYEHLDLPILGGGVIYISNYQFVFDYTNGNVSVSDSPNYAFSTEFHVKAYSGDYGACSPEARQFVEATIKIELEKFNFDDITAEGLDKVNKLFGFSSKIQTLKARRSGKNRADNIDFGEDFNSLIDSLSKEFGQ